MDLKADMKSIAETVNSLIRNDSFPDTIQPEELRIAVRAYPELGGKRLRPVLLLWSCGMMGGNPEKALHAAAAVEIFHNWTLVHDDIIDCDDIRRGEPTSHVSIARYAREKLGANEDDAQKFGSDLAILTGDVQQAWAVNMMLKLADDGVNTALVIALTRRMQEFLNRELISGEAVDVEQALLSPDAVSPDAVLKMICGKTSALLTFSIQCGAAIAMNSADFESPEQKTLEDFSRKLGLAFQLQDDLLDVYGKIDQFGKPLCRDFRECKPTLLYLEAKRRLSGDKANLLDAMMGKPFYSSQMVDTIRRLLTECGAEDFVREQCRILTEESLAALMKMPDNEYRTRLYALAEHLLKRNI